MHLVGHQIIDVWKYLLFVESPNQAATILGKSSDLTYMSSL